MFRTSHDISPHKNKIDLTASVIRTAELEIKGSTEPEQIFYGGEIKGESSIIYEDEIGSSFVNTYFVTNRGPWQVGRIEVQIQMPSEANSKHENGKWLLYPFKAEVQTKGYCEQNYINPLGFKVRLS